MSRRVDFAFARPGQHTGEVQEILRTTQERFGFDGRPFVHFSRHLPEMDRTVVEILAGGELLADQFRSRTEWVEQERSDVRFRDRAGPVQLAEVACRGYLEVRPADRLQRPEGTVRLPVEHLTSTIKLARGHTALEYTGPVYRDGKSDVETLCVEIAGYHVRTSAEADLVEATVIAVTGPCPKE